MIERNTNIILFNVPRTDDDTRPFKTKDYNNCHWYIAAVIATLANIILISVTSSSGSRGVGKGL